ncbi:hypothetical protein BCR32DRAFT_290116 [Anaeromyces robustus]|uniref:Acyltransferase 3 domain-containing protein n=1 Tax=Anaeromyces robustus TaxID=1754192 RepID=A0A1Y1XKG9_9FUNG|nr:hypothetical protein BCR32DRAFT_290116 [Anaeromyces robustus]|eukprot:ORX86259.1 hypothetical protein BCR32DRAFT_290116 [Anaeromyces robustus]
MLVNIEDNQNKDNNDYLNLESHFPRNNNVNTDFLGNNSENNVNTLSIRMNRINNNNNSNNINYYDNNNDTGIYSDLDTNTNNNYNYNIENNYYYHHTHYNDNIKRNKNDNNTLMNMDIIYNEEDPMLNEPKNKKSKRKFRAKNKKKKRIYWIDCLRVFSSFLVVFIHCNNLSLKPDIDYKTHNGRVFIIYCSLTRPCVLLFMMISGMFFLNPRKEITTKMIYTKYIPRLLKCYIFWSIYYTIFDRFIINYDQTEYTFNFDLIKDTFNKIIIDEESHLWYIDFTIGAYIVTPIYREVIKNRKIGWYLVGISTFFAHIIPTIHEFFLVAFDIDLQIIRTYIKHLNINTAGKYLAYYIFGYMIATHHFSKKKYIYYSYLVGILGAILSVIFRFMACYYYDANVHFLAKYYSFNVAMNAFGIFMFFKYSVRRSIRPLIKLKIFRDTLSKLSECSLGIYLIHMSVYHFLCRINFHSQTFDPLLWSPIYSLILYILCFYIVKYLREIPFFKIVT